MNDPRTWLSPKKYGIGWTARTWEGWATVGTLGVIAAVANMLAR